MHFKSTQISEPVIISYCYLINIIYLFINYGLKSSAHVHQIFLSTQEDFKLWGGSCKVSYFHCYSRYYVKIQRER